LKIHLVRPQEHDLRFALGDLEALVLRNLWETDQAFSVRELQDKLSRTRSLAVTTVATILDRLHHKGIVSRKLVKDGGPHYLYSARVTEGQFKHEVVDNVMSGLLRSFNDVTMAYLSEIMTDHGNKNKDLRKLSKYLNRLRQKGNK
jgi:predicted transcriptional regulator